MLAEFFQFLRPTSTPRGTHRSEKIPPLSCRMQRGVFSEGGLVSGVLVVARTEQKHFVAPSIVSLFDEMVDVPLPGVKVREKVLKACITTELARASKERPTKSAHDILTACADSDVISSLAGKPLIDTILELHQTVRDIIAIDSRNTEFQGPGSAEYSSLSAPVATCTSVQAAVVDAILLPRKFSAIYSTYGVFPPTAVLLHGPPGTGK